MEIKANFLLVINSINNYLNFFFFFIKYLYNLTVAIVLLSAYGMILT